MWRGNEKPPVEPRGLARHDEVMKPLASEPSPGAVPQQQLGDCATLGTQCSAWFKARVGPLGKGGRWQQAWRPPLRRLARVSSQEDDGTCLHSNTHRPKVACVMRIAKPIDRLGAAWTRFGAEPQDIRHVRASTRA